MEVGVVSGNTRGWFGPFGPLGHQPRGLIIYTPDGYMSAQLSTADRPDFGSGDWFAGTADDYAAEATSYIAYSGRFHVDEEKQTLTHSMFVSLFPNWTGQTQPRRVKLEDDRLHLGTASPIRSSGKTIRCSSGAEPNPTDHAPPAEEPGPGIPEHAGIVCGALRSGAARIERGSAEAVHIRRKSTTIATKEGSA